MSFVWLVIFPQLSLLICDKETTTKQVWSIHSNLIHMNAYWIMVKFCVSLDLQLQILLVKNDNNRGLEHML